ncbi:Growth-arrest specific micro-tubule binding [Trebouxia sp. C0010 RCD-2024]
MPPKASKKPTKEGKDKKGKKDAPAAAGVDVVSVDELNQKIATLEKEKNKEEEYRNYMQLERVSCNYQDVVNILPYLSDCVRLACLACLSPASDRPYVQNA